jgi:hypothetical protein
MAYGVNVLISSLLCGGDVSIIEGAGAQLRDSGGADNTYRPRVGKHQ